MAEIIPTDRILLVLTKAHELSYVHGVDDIDTSTLLIQRCKPRHCPPFFSAWHEYRDRIRNAFGRCRITVPVFGSVPTASAAKNLAGQREPIVVQGLNREVGNGPIRAVSEMRKGQQWRVKAMQELIEFYEMVSLNDAALRGSEKTAILKARLAMSMFEQAMESFKRASTGAPSVAGSWLGMAA